MRNIFDQYTQPENRLSHSLASVIHEDRQLLKAFINAFGPEQSPDINSLIVIEQGLPGKLMIDDEEDRRGLPDILIFNEAGWVLIIESKISCVLTQDQLQRHYRTVQRCGFDNIHGLTITIDTPSINLSNWSMITWRDVYAWGNKQKLTSHWAKRMIDYFNIAEAKMANDAYLTEGTITEFSGISFDPYTYLEGKRILRLLMKKIRDNVEFLDYMGIDRNASGRHAISNQSVLWDYLPITPIGDKNILFSQYPHCTIGLDPLRAEAAITFPNGMKTSLHRNLRGEKSETFQSKLEVALGNLNKLFQDNSGTKPFFRLLQRRYLSQRSEPIIDGWMEFDLRTIMGEANPIEGPAIRSQPQWANAVFELLQNKNSNIQVQLGVCFDLEKCEYIKSKEADQLFISVFKALKPFVDRVIND